MANYLAPGPTSAKDGPEPNINTDQGPPRSFSLQSMTEMTGGANSYNAKDTTSLKCLR